MSRGVTFESVDITTDPDGPAALEALGVRTVPVVARGERWTTGVRLDRVAELLGLDHDDTPSLAPAELVATLDVVLTTMVRLTRQIPPDRLLDPLPNRDRSYLALANHVAEIANGFNEVTTGAGLSGERAAAVPETNLDVDELTARVEEIKAKIVSWWRDTDDPSCSRLVDTFAGEQDLHRVLERTTWHCAQHGRQLAMVLELLGVVPDRPLGPAELDGLPLPTDVWEG